MTDTEAHYAQIQKVALAITLACEKFSDYILAPLKLTTSPWSLSLELRVSTTYHLMFFVFAYDWIVSPTMVQASTCMNLREHH